MVTALGYSVAFRIWWPLTLGGLFMSLASVLLLTRSIIKRTPDAWVDEQTVIDGGTADNAPWNAARIEARRDYRAAIVGLFYAFVGTVVLALAELKNHHVF